MERESTKKKGQQKQKEREWQLAATRTGICKRRRISFVSPVIESKPSIRLSGDGRNQMSQLVEKVRGIHLMWADSNWWGIRAVSEDSFIGWSLDAIFPEVNKSLRGKNRTRLSVGKAHVIRLNIPFLLLSLLSLYYPPFFLPLWLIQA